MTRDELFRNIQQKQSFLCVGLDTDPRKLPAHLQGQPDAVFTFNKAIIDATAPYCIAYKPNLAFYEAQGVAGWVAFEQTVRYIREHYPDQFIIADAKRGDIGNTSTLYARSFFEEMDLDAVTVAPYMGEDSVMPFLGYTGKWVILLALTSNKGSGDFQMVHLHESPSEASSEEADSRGHEERLFERVLRVSQEWEQKACGEAASSMMYVVGATQGSLFADIRRLAPHHFLLVPGIGAQGGSLEEVCRYGWNDHCGLIVNSSRAIIFADSTTRFAEVAAEKAQEVQKQMAEQLRLHGAI